MNTTGTGNLSFSFLLQKMRLQRGLVFGLLIIGALLAFEIFNYSTTDYALGDLLGDLTFLGVRWSTILAIAFCGIDFAGIARLFTPETGANEPNEVWYLFGAWMLAATMNAMLTWWGVSLALLNHQSLGNAVVERQMLLRVVPVFVAIMVWLIRVLIIGTFSVAGDRLFSQANARSVAKPAHVRPIQNQSNENRTPLRRPVPSQAVPSFRSTSKNVPVQDNGYSRQEPTYHPIAMSPRNSSGEQQRKL